MAPRNSGWSSTSRMRIGSCAGILHLIVNWPRMRPLGDVRDDTRSATWYRVDGKASVEQGNPFTHRVKPEPVPVELRAARVEAVTVVLDNEGRRGLGLSDVDDRGLCARVLADVRQGLLDDPDHLDLGTRREGKLVGEVRVQRGCYVGLLAVLDQVGAQVVQQSPLGS